MKKIRIIHCVGCLNIGGAETLLVNIFKTINRNEFQFDFLTFNSSSGFYDNTIKELGGKIYTLPSISEIGLIRYIKKLTVFFKVHNPDVVHSHMDWQGGFIAYAAHKAGIKKIIVHSHANQKMFQTSVLRKGIIYLNRILINRYSTYCVACSKIAGDSLFNQYSVVLNGIDINSFLNPDIGLIKKIKRELKIDDRDIILGTIGSLSQNKNHIFLINILSELLKYNNNYKLIIVGKGEMEGQLKREVKRLNLESSVVFLGQRTAISEILQVFNLFLFPSIKEGLGIVAIEAQVCGLPCIVSTGVPRDVVINDNIVFLPLQKELWIKNILNISLEKVRVNKAALSKSEFNIENTCKSFEKMYKI